MNLLTAFLHLPFLLAQADSPTPGDSPLPDATPSLAPDATPGFSPAGTPPVLTEEQMNKLAGGLAAFGLVFFVIFAVIALLTIIGMGKTFSKAGKPGWACIIPVYNMIVMCEIAGRPAWWFLIMGLVFPWIIVCIDIAKRFGKGTGFGLGLAFLSPLFFPILGFGSARYLGNSGAPAGYAGGYPPATM